MSGPKLARTQMLCSESSQDHHDGVRLNSSQVSLIEVDRIYLGVCDKVNTEQDTVLSLP